MMRWIKDIFIVKNIVNFSPHNYQASSSKAKCIDVNTDEIIRRSCWKNQKNFDKEITEHAPDDIDFSRICSVNNNDFYIVLLINWS